jgi:hypothetical protein
MVRVYGLYVIVMVDVVARKMLLLVLLPSFVLRIKKTQPKFSSPKRFCTRLSHRSFAFPLTLFLSQSFPPPSVITPFVARAHVRTMSAMRIYNALTGSMTEVNPDEFLR